jgi:hypothetical protein
MNDSEMNNSTSSSNEPAKILLSIDEELQLIKGESETKENIDEETITNNTQKSKRKSKTPKKQKPKITKTIKKEANEEEVEIDDKQV